MINEVKSCGLLQNIDVVLRRLVHNADSLLLDMDNNAAECYNSVVAKFVGGKRIKFSNRGSYQLLCEAASLSFNVGAYEYTVVIHRAITRQSPGKFTRKFMSKHRKQFLSRQTRNTFSRKSKKI